MSRHTTVFTTNPVYRARNELRNRLERVAEEARVTASCVGSFSGNESEQAMWSALDDLCQGMIHGLEAANEIDRASREAQRRQAREVSGPGVAETALPA